MKRPYKYGEQDVSEYRRVEVSDIVVLVSLMTSTAQAGLLSPVVMTKIHDAPPVYVRTDEHSGRLIDILVFRDTQADWD